VSWLKSIVTLLCVDPAPKILEKDSPPPLAELSPAPSALVARGPTARAGFLTFARLSKTVFGELRRQRKDVALEKAIAEWIAERGK
jgi:hypothetical protein